jgi:S-adenosylmethionine:tRNA ribosyltransferase-isomerase
MKLSGFDYDLPPALIAQEPSRPRDKCRLMRITRKDGAIEDLFFSDLASLLNKGDVLVVNDSKVIPARIMLPEYGAKAELLLIRRLSEGRWVAIGRPGKKLKAGCEVIVNDTLRFSVDSVTESGQRIVTFSVRDGNVESEIEKAGSTPLPPYIEQKHGKPEDDYQTVYAEEKGSVAAPTAGLHFTTGLLRKLKRNGVGIVHVTLHVGPGTFVPVKNDDIRFHKMHSEYFSISPDAAVALNAAMQHKRRIIAVGTTSVRVLESAYEGKGSFKAQSGETSIFIYPGYRWKCVDSIITNFHLPKSTLIMLVCAFAGKRLTMKAYKEAIRRKYRFYSYGDAMFIE